MLMTVSFAQHCSSLSPEFSSVLCPAMLAQFDKRQVSSGHLKCFVMAIQLVSRRTNRNKRTQCSSHGRRWQHHRLSSGTANLKQQLPVHQHQKRPMLIRDRCATKSLCWKATKRTRTPKLAEPCKGSAHASCRSSRLSKFRFRFVLCPAMLAQFDQSQCTHAR